MNDEVLERLLWELGDGSISADDRARLEAFVAGNPEAQRRQREVKAFTDLLGGIGDVAVPVGLNERIVRAVAARPRPRARPRWTEVVRDVFAPRWRVRLAWVSVGLLVGVAVTTLVVSDFGESSNGDVSKFYGTVGRAAPGGPPAEIELPDGRGTLTVGHRGGEVVVDLAAASPAAGGLTVEVSGAPLTVVSFEATGTPQSRLEVGAGTVAGELAGAGQVSLRLAAPETGGPLTVRVLAGREELLRREIAAGAHARD